MLLFNISIDCLTILTVLVLMVRRMSFWHPLTAYLFFHIYSFSYRAIQINLGAPLMYYSQAGADMITLEEIERAMFWADAALVIFALGAWLAHARFDSCADRPIIRREMNLKIVKAIGCVCLPIGLVFMYGIRAAAGNRLEVEDNAMVGYAQVLGMWPIGVLGLMIFAMGFRWYLVLSAFILLGTVALQGYHRFMLILPLIYFTAYYLMTKRLRWPTWPILMGALIVALIFPRLKYIGRAVQNGDTSEAFTYLAQSFNFAEKTSDASNGIGEGFLDQYAGALTLIQQNERKFWGAPYIAIITLPVPRAWWPGKPGLADHLKEISTNGRDYAREGRIITYLGEAYLNFGYAGLWVIPLITGYLLTLFCLQSTVGPIARFGRYFYLVIFMALIQTFRDGLASLVLFSVVHNMPMLFACLAHLIPGVATKIIDRPPADPLVSDEDEARYWR